MKKIAIAEAEKAAESFRKHAEQEAQKKAEMERLAGPSGLSEEEKIQLAAKVIRRVRCCMRWAYATARKPVSRPQT